MATIPSLALIPSGYKASKVYSVLPTDGTGDFTFTRSGNATRINSEGLIELVTTNVPRLNYPLIDGVVQGCPSLLLEPSRSNLITYSEAFDNIYWDKTTGGTGSVAVVTSNTIISPDGTVNADTIVFNSGAGTTTSDQSNIGKTISISNATTYTFSIYLKGLTGGEEILFRGSDGAYVKSVLTNEWKRYSFTSLSTSTVWGITLGLRQGLSGIGTINSTASVYAFGAQLEQGSYATSYIPTQGATATRVAETCIQTPPSGIIGQTEGTIFAHFKRNGNIVSRGGVVFLREDFLRGLSINYINNTLYAISRNDAATTTVVLKTPFDINETAKVAITYNGSVFSGFLNGVKIFTDSVFNPFDTIVTEIRVSYGANSGSDIEIAPNSMKDVRVYTTVLTDQECINLTTL